jgi:flagellar biosynthesis anti-sigma factor FlgM
MASIGRTELKSFNARSILELQVEFKPSSEKGPVMRIDLNHTPQLPEPNRSSAQSASAAANASASEVLGGEDQAQLSGTHAQVLALVAQASQLPEVREERVQQLRQAIQSGQYQASPENTASAVLDHLIARPAA